MMLTSQTLKGTWALVPTPWDDDDRLDEAALRHDVSYLSRCGVEGLYTTASSGEFFAIEFDEFRRLVDIVTGEAGPSGCGLQVCCAWTDTRGALKRVAYAAQRGVHAVQVILPYYIRLTLAEAIAFLADVARVAGDVPLVHYNTSHAKLTFEADDYRRVKERVPSLIGTKLVRGEPLWFAAMCHAVPELSHFTAEYTLAADVNGGARGTYSWLAVTNPRLAIHWFAACRDGDWPEAMRLQGLVNRFKIEVKSTYRGASDAAVNKADAMVNPNIRCGLRVRGPYASCTADDVEHARAWAARHFPELLAL